MITRAVRSALVGLGIALGVAVLVLVTSARVPETYPWGDTATTSIAVMRAARGELATGAYSRFQWNHPGPLLYELLAPLYRLSGYHEISLKWSVLALNLTTLTALLFVVVRRAPMLAISIAATLSPLLYREQRLLFWAWNPIAPLLPLALAIALGAGIAAGDVALLPWLVAVASFIVQTHVGFTPLIAAIALAVLSLRASGLGSRLQAPGSGGSRPEISSRSPRPVAWSLFVFTLLWAVPLVHELRTRPGNLVSLSRFFLHGSSSAHPWSDVLVIYANQLIGPLDPRWELTTSAASTARSWIVIVAAFIQLPLLLLVAVRARRREAAFEHAAAVICLAASLVGMAATHAIAGPISDYLVIWLAVIGALNLAVIGSEAIEWLVPASGGDRSGWRLALVAYLAVFGALGATRLIGKQSADARSVIVRDLSEELRRYCQSERIDRPVLGFSWPAWQLATGMALQFYKEGRPIALSDEYVYLAGEPFRARDRDRATGQESGEFYLMPQDTADLPAGVNRYVWLGTLGGFRLVRVFRESH